MKYYTDQFIHFFDISDEPRERILLEDDLRATYLKFYNDGADQVEAAMEDTYQYHADLLAAQLDAQVAQRLRGGGTADNNLNIDAVVQPPVNDARNNRAPDDDPGNDDSDDDDDDDDDWDPGNNNPGNPGGNNNDTNDGNEADWNDGPVAGVIRRREGNDPGDSDPPPPGGGAADQDDPEDDPEDEPGDYRRGDIFLANDIGAYAFVYDAECRLVRRALWLCEIADAYHANYFAQAGITTFARLALHTHSSWKGLQVRLAKNRTFTAAHDFQINSLTAISMWVNAKIVHGSFTDVSSLYIQDIQNIVRREVCVDVPNRCAYTWSHS